MGRLDVKDEKKGSTDPMIYPDERSFFENDIRPFCFRVKFAIPIVCEFYWIFHIFRVCKAFGIYLRIVSVWESKFHVAHFVTSHSLVMSYSGSEPDQFRPGMDIPCIEIVSSSNSSIGVPENAHSMYLKRHETVQYMNPAKPNKKGTKSPYCVLLLSDRKIRIAMNIGIQTTSTMPPISTYAIPLFAVNLLTVISILSSFCICLMIGL